MRLFRSIPRPVLAGAACVAVTALTGVMASQSAGTRTPRNSGRTSAPETHSLNLKFAGAQPRPLAMVQGDFDEDGVADLAIGYGTEDGGSITVVRGNPDALAPKTHAEWLAVGRHEYLDAFEQKWKAIELKTEPGLMATADVNGDGHLDLVFASTESNRLHVRFGNGKGGFSAKAAEIALPGKVTAIDSYKPGMPYFGAAVTVGWESKHGAGVSLVLATPRGLAIKATYKLPGRPTMFSVGQLDNDFIADTAIVAGGELLVLHGKNAIEGRGELESLHVTGVERAAVGSFFFDRHLLPQISLLTTRGEVLYLAHEGFDPRPYTPEQIAEARRDAMTHGKHKLTLAQLAGINGNKPWVEIERHTEPALRSLDAEAAQMVRGRMNGNGVDDVVVLNGSQQQRVTIDHKMLSANAPAALLAKTRSNPYALEKISVQPIRAGNIVAALAMRVNADGRSGLVVLRDNDASPEITIPAAGNTFYVTTTADNTGSAIDAPNGTRCDSTQSEPCTLRDAITYANEDQADNGTTNSDTIMVPAGTYPLSFLASQKDTNDNLETHLEIFGPVTITGDPGGAVIDAQSKDTILAINPGPVGTTNSGGTSIVFDATLENLTLENGKNQNNLSNNGNANYGGGALDWDADGTGNLTLTEVIVTTNDADWGPGGGIWAINSAGGGSGTLTIQNTTIESNQTSEQGGGLYIGFPAAAFSVSRANITGNKASASLNPSDTGGSDSTCSGGGVFATGRASGSGTPDSTIDSSTITSNTANGTGGGINTSTGLTLSNSLISGNSSAPVSSTATAYFGGGFWSEVNSDETTPTLTGDNFLSNSATSGGGGIAQGADSKADGNTLQINLSRIYGNTSTHGASGLAMGEPSGSLVGDVEATDNWWGCNAGPITSADGCDQSAKYPTGTGLGTMNVTPNAVFLLSATSPTTFTLGGSIGFALTLDSDSSNNPITNAYPALSSGPYQFSFALTGVTGNAIPNGSFASDGAASALETPTEAGTGHESATFDGQTDTVDFTVSQISTSLTLSAVPSSTYTYGQPTDSFSVTLNPTSATGITGSDFAVTVDGASSIGASSFAAVILSGTDYNLTGPFNLVSPGTHTLAVTFIGTTDYATSNTSIPITVSLGAVTLSPVVSPASLVQFQGGSVQVTVIPTGSGATPTGTLSFSLDGGSPGTVALSGGAGTFAIPTVITPGSHSYSVVYSGDVNYGSASTTVPFTVGRRSQTFFHSLTTTAATIDVFGFGFTAPSGSLAFNDLTTSSPVTAPVTLNTASATTALTPQVTTSTGTNTLPDWTELKDINGDGIPDLITSLYATDSINVQIGNGDGTFQAASPVFITTGFGPAEAHLVSLRGNGTLDLIVGSFNMNEIAVLLGNGDGTFQTPVFYTVGSATNTPTSLTTGDFNHDGKLDVAVANTLDNTVSILTGDGSGALTLSGSPINVGHDPEAIRAGDFDGDGYSDLVVANYQDGTVTTLYNQENGTFNAVTIPVGSAVESGPQALAITGSAGNLMFAVANFKDNSVSVLKSQGNGTFGAQTIVSVGAGPDDLNFADFNGDGIQDLVVSNFTDGSVNLVLGSSGGSYTVSTPFPIGTHPYSAAVGDIDSDGTPDVVVSNTFDNNIGVLLGGTQIAVPYSGLSLTSANQYQGAYTPDGASAYAASSSPATTP